MRPEKRCPYYAIILLILIVLTFDAKSIDPQPPTPQPKAPKWARPGIYLSYAWALYEWMNKSEVERIVRSMLLSPLTVGDSEINFTLTDVDEDRGFFNITTQYLRPRAVGPRAVATYYWENGTLVVTDPATGRASSSYFPLYLYAIPENASVVRVSTIMGENEAYLVKHEDQSVIEYFYYHKDIGVLLAWIELGESEHGVDIWSLVLFDTNVTLTPTLTPTPTPTSTPTATPTPTPTATPSGAAGFFGSETVLIAVVVVAIVIIISVIILLMRKRKETPPPA